MWNKLIPVKPGSDTISIVEKENRKTTSKKKNTIYVAQSACVEENKEITNGAGSGKTTDDTSKHRG
jgi:hypothetical protein